MDIEHGEALSIQVYLKFNKPKFNHNIIFENDFKTAINFTQDTRYNAMHIIKQQYHIVSDNMAYEYKKWGQDTRLGDDDAIFTVPTPPNLITNEGTTPNPPNP